MSKILLFLVLLMASSCFAQSQLGDIWNKASQPAQPATPTSGGPSTSKISSGLKEALTLGTGKAVASTGKPDGFLKNEAIKILLPDNLRTAGKGARLLGMGSQVDELEVGMNRAAEQATPLAKQIFLKAISKMTFDDARKILSGGDTAATEYFKRQTTAELTTSFTPIVHKSLVNVGVVKQYNTIMQNSIAGSLGAQKFNLDNYVVGKTLDGLFYMLGQEEKKIRKDPAAQTTSLLKDVFGKHM
ncbi:MAG: DUF4197 domain-containing protein [Terriglobales bacterium]